MTYIGFLRIFSKIHLNKNNSLFLHFLNQNLNFKHKYEVVSK